MPLSGFLLFVVFFVSLLLRDKRKDKWFPGKFEAGIIIEDVGLVAVTEEAEFIPNDEHL